MMFRPYCGEQVATHVSMRLEVDIAVILMFYENISKPCKDNSVVLLAWSLVRGWYAVVVLCFSASRTHNVAQILHGNGTRLSIEW